MKMTSVLKWLFVVNLLIVPLFIRAQSNNYFAVQTKIENGIIEGFFDTKTGLQLYLGIPYAKPPVGDLRWKAPQPIGNWNGVKETKKFGPRAVQAPIYGDMIFRSDGISEDCLYLNVWTPAKHNESGLPVFVYFYGGGFKAGDGSEPRYDGASMAKKGIVVVTINYRLNIFGFFSHPELSAEAPYKASGNYGLLDQNAALRWVQKNIAAFGGDPKKVTIAGESAGSLSVSAQMASPLSKGLFAGAIGESGALIHPTFTPVPLNIAEKTGIDFLQKAGNITLQQLRAMSTRELYEIYVEIYYKYNEYRFPAVIDGYFLPKTLPEIFNAKEQAQIPLLLGWNSAEIPGMDFMSKLPYTPENFIRKVKEKYPSQSDDLLKILPHTNDKEVEISATKMASDSFIVYSTWKWFDLQRKNSDKPVYRYLFGKIRPVVVDPDVPKMSEPIGAPHASDIEYCMGNLYLVKDYAWTRDDYKVSETMQSYFANFIKTGNPNGAGLPEWPAADAKSSNPPVMILNVDSRAVNSEDDALLLIFDKIFSK